MAKEQRREYFSPEAFAMAHDFLRVLKKAEKFLTRNEMIELRRQALKGDICAAGQALNTIVRGRKV